MAVTRLSDVFIPSVYGSYTALNNPENSQLVSSGVISTNAAISAIARGGNKTGTVPFWRDIDPTIEPNYSNDDPADMAVPNKLGTGSMIYRKAFVNQWFSEMDLVSELLNGESSLEQVRNRFGTYWQRQMERRLIASCVGILADNIANDAGDMLVDISAVGDGKFSSDSFIDASYTLGDNVEALKAIAVHSMIAARMEKNDDIDTIRDSDGNVLLRSYKGRAVVVDDNLPTSGSGANTVYTSILFGTGSFGFGGEEGHVFALGEGVPKEAAEVFRVPLAGHGGGQEAIGERKTWLLHPFGFSWVEGGAAIAEFSPSNADLRLAAHWDRVVSRKQAPMAFIKSKA